MLLVRKEYNFSAAHKLPYHKGQCRRLHGHNYKVIVSIAGPKIVQPEAPDFGMVLDFEDLDYVMTSIVNALDHFYINEIDTIEIPLGDPPRQVHAEGHPSRLEWPFARTIHNPTAENLATDIASYLMLYFRSLTNSHVRVEEVEVFETPKASAIWRNDDYIKR